MSAELKLQWKVPGSVHLQKVHLHLPRTSFLHCNLNKTEVGVFPAAGRQPLVVHSNLASGKVLGSKCVGAQMMPLAVPAWMCQYDGEFMAQKKTSLLASAAISRQNPTSLRRGLGWWTGSLLRIAENNAISLHHLVSQSALSASLSGLNSGKPNLGCPWNSCGCSAN